jgi:ribosomal protein S18 acetylase RimI-like enzyme
LSTNNYIVKEIKKENFSSIYKIHKETFDKTHFLSYLKENLLVKYYEKLIIYNKYCYMIANEKENEINGFLFAGYKTHFALNEFTKENKFSIIFALLSHPKFIVEKIKLVLAKQFNPKLELKADLRLIIIGVSTQFKGAGMALKLLQHFENEIGVDGAKLYGLSVRKGNQRAINFYLKNKFKIETTFMNSVYFYKDIN